MPRSGCEKVIESTKAMRNNSSLHHVEAFGIIDMDYRGQNEINSLQRSGVFPLNVALVENLLCVPEILKIVAENQALDSQDICQKVSDFLINTLTKELEEETSKRSASEIRFKLSLFNSKVKAEEDLKQQLTTVVNSIDVSQIYKNNLNMYKEVIEFKDYKKALLIYKKKAICNEISKFFNLHHGEYRNLVVRLLSTERKDAIVSELKNYTPQLTDLTLN
jgi:hypothetical protein